MQVQSGAGRGDEKLSASVTGNYFPTLGGRRSRTLFGTERTAPGAHPVAVVSHGLWQRRFGADPWNDRQDDHINGQQLTVIGVSARRVSGAWPFGIATEVWTPLTMQPQLLPERIFRGSRTTWLNVSAG